MASDQELRVHSDWIGLVQPFGVVAKPAALVRAGAFPNRNIVPVQRQLADALHEVLPPGATSPTPALKDLPQFLVSVLGWQFSDLVGIAGAEPIPEGLQVALPDYEDVLRPTYAVRDAGRAEGDSEWLLLVLQVRTAEDLDALPEPGAAGWRASAQSRFERLLRKVGVPIGLLSNGTSLRLVYAPDRETSGYATFPVKAMAEVGGRPILSAFEMLLGADRLFNGPRDARLSAILSNSRKFQAEVSTKLAEQVLGALYELMRGFQAADARQDGRLLGDVVREQPNHVYEGLLTVLLRMVFVLFAEDRDLMPRDPVYARHYSLAGLYERLREDAGRFTDTMDQRYGAWAHLLALFRLIHDGARRGGLSLPARHGSLFGPDRFPFLEGRPVGVARVMGEGIEPPWVPDGTVFRVLERLLVLDGERIAYRGLDVEEIGSIYQAMMGFSLERVFAPTIALKPGKPHGAPVPVDLGALLAVAPGERAKWLKERTDHSLSGAAAEALKSAGDAPSLVAALDRRVARHATPNILEAGAMVLVPSDERRRSGSHYTPRSLTEPIVRVALRPVLERLGDHPTPEQILGLRVCDPAMGSGAFLVEACRQLGDELMHAWQHHRVTPKLPPDEDEILHAQRLVAQRCLYGVDRNRMAVELAKLSLWLATLARDHAFTFVDHALRHGDSLVGMSRAQIAGFHWEPEGQLDFIQGIVADRMAAAASRREVIEGGEALPESELHALLVEADDALEDVRAIGDALVGLFFQAGNARMREAARRVAMEVLRSSGGDFAEGLGNALRSLRASADGLWPFHWEVEYPEVFSRAESGFDAFVGNPPFMGGTRVSANLGDGYRDWLLRLHAESHGNADLVAHFFRRAFGLLRTGGCLGFIATNTIAQGDTRSTGLRWICVNGGSIVAARRRYRWPGEAAVIVSVVHVMKGPGANVCVLDGREVERITAYLFSSGGHEDPAMLSANRGLAFLGAKVYGQGFLFDDTDASANPISVMRTLVAQQPGCAELVRPYIGGQEINESPSHASHRYVIDLGEMGEEEARKWPGFWELLERSVKPERALLRDNPDGRRRKEKWWLWGRYPKALFKAISGLSRVLVISRVSPHLAFAFLPSSWVFSDATNVFAVESYATFGTMQSRIHEVWARFFSSSLKDDLRYAPSDCFDTYPFPLASDALGALDGIGRDYYQYRREVMVASGEGLTKTYNRFHNPDETDPVIQRLRDLHATLDAAVMRSYGWDDLALRCEFLLDFEEDDEGEVGSARRKPWRFRWPDDLRDEVLGRLLHLNEARVKEEQLSGRSSENGSTNAGVTARRPVRQESFDL